MTLLIIGLLLFLGIHSLPMATTTRDGLQQRLGENRYKGLFTLISLVGLVLIVWGYSRAPFQPVYAPVNGALGVAHGVMPIALILLAAANMPTHIRRVLKHPMLIGVLLWSGVHLMANGDLRSILLFGGFGLYAVIDLISEIRRGRDLIGGKPARWPMDLAAVVGGLVLYGLLLYFHGTLFGMPVLR